MGHPDEGAELSFPDLSIRRRCFQISLFGEGVAGQTMCFTNFTLAHFVAWCYAVKSEEYNKNTISATSMYL